MDYRFWPLFAYRADAVAVLSAAKEYIETHGIVTIKQFNEWVGEEVHSENELFGWTDLNDAYVDSTNHGYELVLPNMRKFKSIKLKH
jgi:hypothetical protein